MKGIAFDIIFQNKDPDEERFAEVLKNSKNSVIASTLDICTPYNTPAKVLDELRNLRPDSKIVAYCDNIDYFGSILEQKYKEKNLIKFHPAECSTDEDGKYKTCEGIPRSVYNSVPWGLASMEGTADRKIPYYTVLSGSALPIDKFVPTLGIAVYS